MIPLEYGIGVCGHHHSAAFAHVWHHFGPAEVTSTTAGRGGGGGLRARRDNSFKQRPHKAHARIKHVDKQEINVPCFMP